MPPRLTAQLAYGPGGIQVNPIGWTPRRRILAIRAGAVLFALAVHLSLWVFNRPDPNFHQPDPAVVDALGPPPIEVRLLRPPKPPTPNRTLAATARRGPDDRPKAAAPIAGPVARPSPARFPAPAEALAAGAVTPGRNPGRQQGSPGLNWGQTPPDAAARRALRTSAGCDYGIALTRAEQDRCDERMGRDRNRPRRNLPLMADRARQAEFDRDASYKDRLRDWKSEPAPAGTNIFDSALGTQPPRR
jgi:hypothetical protein